MIWDDCLEKEGFKQLLYTRRLKDLIFSSNRIREKWEIILTRESSYRQGESFTTVCKPMLNPGKLVSSGLERSLSRLVSVSVTGRAEILQTERLWEMGGFHGRSSKLERWEK